jgi:hypothetical protein
MINRCENPKSPKFHIYGALGINVCPEWRADFLAFLEDMGERPSDAHSIDRIDPNGNYEPTNCRWATKTEQARNQRRTLFVIADDGIRYSAPALAARFGHETSTITRRIKAGITALELFSLPYLVTVPYRPTPTRIARKQAYREQICCKRGHERTEANGYWTKEGHWFCRACANEAQWRKRHAAV